MAGPRCSSKKCEGATVIYRCCTYRYVTLAVEYGPRWCLQKKKRPLMASAVDTGCFLIFAQACVIEGCSKDHLPPPAETCPAFASQCCSSAVPRPLGSIRISITISTALGSKISWEKLFTAAPHTDGSAGRSFQPHRYHPTLLRAIALNPGFLTLPAMLGAFCSSLFVYCRAL